MKSKSVTAAPTRNVSQVLYSAAVSHFQSVREESLAVLRIYFQNPVAVGDHPGFLSEIKSATLLLSEADEALETLSKYKNELLALD